MGREGAFPREADRSSSVARLPGSLPAVCSGDAREGFRAGGWPEWSFVARFPTRVNQGGWLCRRGGVWRTGHGCPGFKSQLASSVTTVSE